MRGVTDELKYMIAAAIATDRSRGQLLSDPDGEYATQVKDAAERVMRVLEEIPDQMNSDQAETCVWIMSKNFNRAAVLKDVQLVIMHDGRAAAVLPDGSYRVARLGDTHPKP